MNKTVDARGDQCPIPLVKAKKALKELHSSDVLKVLVDNEIAVQNLLKMAGQMQIYAERGKEDGGFYVEFHVEKEISPDSSAEEMQCLLPETEQEKPVKPKKKNTVVVISSSFMGDGSEELGKILMKGFLYALAQLDEPPACLLFYNGGVKLTTEGSASIEDLKELMAQGVEILSCGTCLDYYHLKDKLMVGEITNMYTIVEKQAAADMIIRP